MSSPMQLSGKNARLKLRKEDEAWFELTRPSISGAAVSNLTFANTATTATTRQYNDDFSFESPMTLTYSGEVTFYYDSTVSNEIIAYLDEMYEWQHKQIPQPPHYTLLILPRGGRMERESFYVEGLTIVDYKVNPLLGDAMTLVLNFSGGSVYSGGVAWEHLTDQLWENIDTNWEDGGTLAWRYRVT